MRILAIPDLHCYPTSHSRMLEGGTPSRLRDWKSVCDALVKLSREQRVDVAVAPGDFFVHSRPPAQAVIEVNSLFARLRQEGAFVAGCHGNHDVIRSGDAGPVDILSHLSSPLWGIGSPKHITYETKGRKLAIAVLPWAPYATLEAGQTWLDEQFDDLSSTVPESDAAILIGHWGIEGATVSSGHALIGEPVISIDKIKNSPFQAVIMGHIHKPQVLLEYPIALHTGSLQRQNFGEEKDPRGCYILDLEEGIAHWHDLPDRSFWTLSLNASQLEDLSKGKSLFDVADLSPASEAICRIQYAASEELHRAIDQKALFEALYDAGADYVSGISADVQRSVRTRAEGLDEHTSHTEALKVWLSMRGDLTEEMKEEILEAAKPLLLEAQSL